MGHRSRPVVHASCLVLALGVALGVPSFAADRAETLGGVVRDALGTALGGVEVLVLPDRSAETLASVVTGEDGRFRVSELPAGLYRIAALKPGYLASVTRANTFLLSSVDLVLHPVPRPGEPGSDNVGADPSWVLRAPARSILRETGMREIAREPASDAGRGRGGVSAVASPSASVDLVDGQFRQLVAVGNRVPERGSSGGSVAGGETSMRLSAALGQRGSVQLEGRRESLSTSPAGSGASPAGSRSAESLEFGLSYDTSRDSNLDVSAYFARGDVRIGLRPDDRSPASREARQAWGYDATWSTQLDPASRLAVSLGYRDASLEVPDAYLPGLAASVGDPARSLSNRSIGATGSYEVLAGDSHLVRVGARVQALDLALPLVREGGEAMFVDLPGGAGWSVRVDAEDAWSVSGPWTLVYGLGIQQEFEGRDATLFVTRTGAGWSPGRLNLRLLLSYSSVADWGERDPEAENRAYGGDRLRANRPLGWEAEVALPIGNGVSLRATQSFEPVRDGRRSTGSSVAPADPTPPIVGTRASDLRNTVALTRQTGRMSSSLSWNWGRAEGLIGQSAGFDLPVQILAERTISYRSGRFDVHVPTSGTDVAFEYGRFEESPAPGATGPLANVYYELAVGQQIAHLARLGATCRLLVEARLVPAHERSQDESVQFERSRTIAALNQQVSAGLLVAF